MDVRLAEKEGFAGLFLRLRAEGLADKTLLTALEQTPRTLFLSAAYSDCAYQDRLVPIDCGGFAESADLVARLIVALGSSPDTGFSIWEPEAVSLRRLQHGLPRGL
jgi:protein-L-isoaspartate(D-aspartate) O-methyltransferase